MDLVLVLIILAVVIFWRKDFKFCVYSLGILEIFFRLIHFLGDHIKFININGFINKYIPESLFSIIDKYTSGIVCDIISWILVFCFCAFLYYLVRYIIKKK